MNTTFPAIGRGGAFAEPEPPGSPADPERREEPINILLVDDEPKNLTALETILDDPGYRLVRVASGEEALLALVNLEFAVILLDIHMPGISGFEVAKMVKKRRKTASVPIIFLTAHYHDDRYVHEGYETGAVDYLLKPIDPAIVRSKVAVFAELFRKTRDSALANAALQAEIDERRRIQKEMHELHDRLEQRVAERTSELVAANAALQQVQSELQAADRRKDQFLAMLGHELRNPLAAIRNAASILRQAGRTPSDVTLCREIIERQSEHLTRLVNDLLDVSRVSRGQIQLERAVFDLRLAAKEAVETCQPLIDARRHLLSLSLTSAPLLVEGDRTRLAQVIANLINNAAKYTDVNGRIDVALERDPAAGRALIRVRDNGRGLAPEAIGRLFELFYQANVNLDRSDGGLGVGLALVRSLVELHGGTVEAHSAGSGQGSEFTVRVPCAPEVTAARTAEPAATCPMAGLRILVVDDNYDAAQTLAMLLSLLGHQTLMAHDGKTAVDVALRERPDVVLLDIGLPGLNGYQVCRNLRGHGLTHELIVAITGYSQTADRQQADEAGFDGHLVKPVSLPTIEQLLARRAARLAATGASSGPA
jgi:signal transduction histidine kinase